MSVKEMQTIDQADELTDDPFGPLAISCFSLIYC